MEVNYEHIISRFARNTRDLLQTLRLLKSYGVTVFFEEQGIDTSQLNSEMFLTFPGMIAQQESESISGNMRWSYKKRMESGEFNCCAPAYGFDLINGSRSQNLRHVFAGSWEAAHCRCAERRMRTKEAR